MPGYPFKAFMDFGSQLSDGNADLCAAIICVTDSSVIIENKSTSTPLNICRVSRDKEGHGLYLLCKYRLKMATVNICIIF